jgi:hypothetical protein
MLMRAERPIEHSRWGNVYANVPLMFVVFGAIAVAVAPGVTIGFPVPADTAAAAWLAQFP